MAGRVSVMLEGKREVVHVTPSTTLLEVLQEVCGKRVDAGKCELRLKNKVLDLTSPIRFAGIPSGVNLVVTSGGKEHGLPRRAPPPPSEQPAEGPKSKEKVPLESGGVETERPPQQASTQPSVVQKAMPSEQRVGSTQPAQTGAAVTPSALNREVRLFSANSASQLPASTAAACADPESDEFYDFTAEDFARLEQSRKKKEAEGRFLKTKAQRDREAEMRARKLPPVIIRIVFPDGIVMESKFSALEPVENVYALVVSSLVCMVEGFYLYTTPPKAKVAKSSAALWREGLVPAAKLYVNITDTTKSTKDILKDSIYALLDKADSSFIQDRPTQPSHPEIEEVDRDTLRRIHEKEQMSSKNGAPQSSTSSKPKWFKM